MGQILSWVALGLGGVALAQSLVRRVPKEQAGTATPLLKPLSLAVVAILALAALLTLPVRPPWSAGQALAPGLILGGLAVLLAAWLGRGSGDDARSRFGSAAAQAAVAAVAVAVLLLVYPRQILDALGGFALGALTAGILLAGALRLAGEEDSAAADAAEGATLAAVALAATTWLATFHLNAAGVREWQPLPALLTATLAVGLAVRGLLASGTGRPWLLTTAAVFLPLLVMAALIALRLNGTPEFVYTVLLGLAVYAAVAWSQSTEAPGGDGRGYDPSTPNAQRSTLTPRSALHALLVLGACVVAFRWLHGYGLGLLVLTGVAVALAVRPAANLQPATSNPFAPYGQQLLTAVTLGLLPVLYRVCEEWYEPAVRFQPEFFYYYVALVLGALLPSLIAGAAAYRKAGSTPSVLLRVGLAGLAAAAAPLLLVFLVGDRPQAAFLVGLPVGIALLLARGAGSAAEASLTRLLSLGMAYSAVQLTTFLTPFESATRMQRVTVLLALGALGALAVAATWWMDRRSAPKASTGTAVPT
jgi:hypothetical protein